MLESPPNKIESRKPWDREDGARLKIEAIIALARELGESRGNFPFPGIDPEAYATLKAGEAENPGCGTPIDELVERFKNEGMKVVLARCADGTYGGDVYILPSHSSDILNDNLFPRHLQISEGMNEKIRELISLSKG